ncbi:MAG: ferrous iron transport protein A [Acutalibacteraceae bacterium]
MKTIGDMKIGESAVVRSIGCTGALRRRLLDMGLTPDAVVSVRRTAPLGDPIEIAVRGSFLSIRRRDAKAIAVAEVVR